MSATLSLGLTPIRTTLGNGAVVIVQETVMAPAVTIHATFQAGTVYEPADLPGLAYLTGRVLDRGTTTRSAEMLAEELDERGVALRVSTNRHHISITCTCLAEDFEDVLRILVDLARRPTFPEVELERRRAEALTALRQDEDNPAVRAVEGLFALLYGATHPYGRRSKGTTESIERIARRDLERFHAARIVPSALTLVIVGDVPTARALDLAGRELEDWSAPLAPEAVVPPPPPAASRRRESIDMPGKSQTDIAYGFTAIRRLDPRYYAYWIMNNILGQFGLGGRLADNIRERQGMAYYAFSAFDPSVAEGPVLVRAGVDPRNVERAIDAIDFEVRRLGTEGPTEAELAETREYLIGSIPRMLETNPSIAVFLQTAEQFGLGLDYDRRLPIHLRAVTLDQVRAAAGEVLRPECATVVTAGPEVPADGD